MPTELEQQLIELTADELEIREKAGRQINSSLFLEVTMDISMNHPNKDLRELAKETYKECQKLFKTHEIVYKDDTSLDNQKTRDISKQCHFNSELNECKIFHLP